MGRWLVYALGALAGVLLLAAGIIAAGFWYWQQAPLPTQTEITVPVPRGTSVRTAVTQVGQALDARAPSVAWMVLARWLELEQVRAGYYAFAPGLSPRAALEQLRRGEVIQDRVTIVEGWTFAQMRAAIEAHPFVTVTRKGQDDAAILRAIGAPVDDAEGWFFPDTYVFERMAEDVEIYRAAHERMKAELMAAWNARDPALPLRSPQELLILASMVEKETGHPEDRGKVASVFVNRLRVGMPLQSDPTVIYGQGERRQGPLTRRHLQEDTPHNTYTRTGLPPTPICLPSRASLWAAAQPPATPFLYFVASGVDGTSVFSRTLEEHNAAVRRYRQALAASRNAGRAGVAITEESRPTPR